MILFYDYNWNLIFPNRKKVCLKRRNCSSRQGQKSCACIWQAKDCSTHLGGMELVSVPPMLSIPNQLEAAYMGQDVSLECHTEAYPSSLNYWITERGDMIVSGEPFPLFITHEPRRWATAAKRRTLHRSQTQPPPRNLDSLLFLEQWSNFAKR